MLKSDVPKVPYQAKAKRDGVINPKNYNFSQFNTQNFKQLHFANYCEIPSHFEIVV